MVTGGNVEASTKGASILAAELRHQIGRLKRRLRAESHSAEFTSSAESVIARLSKDGPATVSMLARSEGMRPQSTGAIVAGLEAAGFLHGAPDPADRRQTMLSLTGTCRDWIEAGRAARQDWLCRSIQKHLSPPERERLADAVELLKRLVD